MTDPDRKEDERTKLPEHERLAPRTSPYTAAATTRSELIANLRGPVCWLGDLNAAADLLEFDRAQAERIAALETQLSLAQQGCLGATDAIAERDALARRVGDVAKLLQPIFDRLHEADEAQWKATGEACDSDIKVSAYDVRLVKAAVAVASASGSPKGGDDDTGPERMETPKRPAEPDNTPPLQSVAGGAQRLVGWVDLTDASKEGTTIFIPEGTQRVAGDGWFPVYARVLPSRASPGAVEALVRTLQVHGWQWPYNEPRTTSAGIALDAALSHMATEKETQGSQKWRPTHRHKKRGTTYVIVGDACLQTDRPLSDNAGLIIYRGEHGELWARPGDEFYDGRFEPLGTEKETQGSQPVTHKP